MGYIEAGARRRSMAKDRRRLEGFSSSFFLGLIPQSLTSFRALAR